MHKCGLCQQMSNNLTHVYNKRIKSLVQIILKLKGFQDSLDANNGFEICGSCKQGIENVSIFWENIPEAKPKLEELREENQEFLSKTSTVSKQHLPAIKSTNQDECEDVDMITKTPNFEPIKLRIKLPSKGKRQHKPVNDFAMEALPKRIRRCPKRYEVSDIASTDKTVLSNENSRRETTKCNESTLSNSPIVALLRLHDGQDVGKLIEVDTKGTTSRIRIICLVCNEIFRFEKPFQSHFKTHNKYHLEDNVDAMKSYLYCCNLCDKTFCDHYTVRRHFTNIHSEERPFKCQFCEANFKYKANLNYHMAKHVPKKHFECVFCSKGFLKRYELQIHLRTHTKERPYKCQFCSFASAHQSNLKTHQKHKHLNIAENSINSKECINIEEEDPIPLRKFVPPPSLVEEDTVMQSYSNNANLIDFPSTRIYGENVTIDLSHEYSENDFSEKENPVGNTAETNANVGSTNDHNITEVTESNEVYKENVISQAMFGNFKLDSSILKSLTSSTLLGLKKWPKSFQTTLAQQEQFSNSSFDSKGNSKTTDLICYVQNSSDPLKSITKYTPTQNYSSDSLIIDNIPASSNTLTSKSNLETSSDSIYNEFLIKLKDAASINQQHKQQTPFIDNKSETTEQQHEQLNDVPHAQFIDKKSETYETKLNMKAENSSVETNNSRILKVSKLLSSENFTITNNVKSLEPNIISKSLNKLVTDSSLTFLETNNQQIANPSCLAITQIPKSRSKSCSKLYNNGSQQSLLKSNLKTQQIVNVSLTNNNENTRLPSKPLITKIEILPPLNTPDILQTASLTTPTTNLIKPPAAYKHQCLCCYKYFKQKSALTKHMRTHTGEKPYKCNLCPKSYADASNYKKHKILHKTAAEALNICATVPYAVQSSPAYSTVSDPDPDGIEVMQTLNRFDCSSAEEDDDDMMDDISTTSSTMETDMWHNALEHALNNDEIRENLMKNLAAINNAILPQAVKTTGINGSTEDPD